MLILSRKIDEKIKIGNDITITLIDVHGDQVKIGVEDPKDVKVMRSPINEFVGTANFIEVYVYSKDELKTKRKSSLFPPWNRGKIMISC